ncbi:MAG: hypothetical protein CMF50_04410 [Legionellales bacterium]|nr:hypothetical protein [Legionellales bacterium]|tara:strand:+ start:2730 stop:3347 length:618 start_codon:yes stop_codon:yes gene_type:complete
MSEHQSIKFKRDKKPSDDSTQGSASHSNQGLGLDEHARSIIRERAKLLAEADDAYEESYEHDYLCFKVGAIEKYGIPFKYLDEILEPMEITPIPGISKVIAGVVNRRGTVLNVIDATTLLGLEASENGQKSILVLRSRFGEIGILIDELVGMSKYDASNLHPAMPSELNNTAAYVEGIWESTIAILNVDAMMDSLNTQLNEVSYS